MEYTLSVARSFTTPPNDQGAVAVIDGKSLKITPFRSANVPPPMSLYEIPVIHNIIDVAFNVEATSIAVLHQNGIALYSWNTNLATSSSPNLIGRFTFKAGASERPSYQQISFGEDDTILTLQYMNGGISSIGAYGFDDETGGMEEKTLSHLAKTSAVLISTFEDGKSAHPFAQETTGDLHSLVVGDMSLVECGFPLFLPWVEIASIGPRRIAFGLSNNGHLYANSRLLLKNCTSFLLTPAHVIFTTTNHLLKFIHITNVEGKLCSL